MRDNNLIHQEILEEVNNNPILTQKEFKDLMYFPTEEEIKSEELITEAICNRIDEYYFQYGIYPSKKILKKIMEEEKIKKAI